MVERLVESGLIPAAEAEYFGIKRWELSGAERLRRAEMFWIMPNMAAAAMDGSTDIPAFAPAVERPSPSGLIGFDKPLPPVDPVAPIPLSDGTTSAVPRPVDLISWYSLDDFIVFNVWTRRGNWAGPGPEVTLGIEIPFVPFLLFDVPANKVLEPGDLENVTHRALFSLIGSAWVMMQTPTVAERRAVEPVGRSSDRARQVGAPTSVTLIDLRALRHVTTAEGGDGSRTYTHRWVVRGHWRNQPHGPGREERRLTWIPSHVKGPADAPFKSTEKVMVWRR